MKAIRPLAGATFVLAALLGGTPVQAQSYPTRAITVIIPFAGGSASDAVTRIVLDRMSKSMGQPIIVENRPGAGGNIGAQAATKATPDGYTLVATGGGSLGINRALVKDFNYNPETELTPISLIATFPFVIVASTKLPVKSVKELIDYAKAKPGELNYGSVGVGSSQHLAGVYFEQITGTKLTHVAYRNIANYTPDLIAGQVPLGFSWFPNVVAALKSDGARALAVASKARLAALPDTPTTAEAGLPEYVGSGIFPLLAPAGTPRAIIDKLHQEVVAASKDPTVQSRIRDQGADPTPSTPEELGKIIKEDNAKWIGIIQKAGMQPQ
jgi:tripartite-type tricarboxylate transporter receptor subunit TctC